MDTATQTARQGLRWDLTSYFPSFNGPEMQDFKRQLLADLESLQERAGKLQPLNTDNQSDWEDIVVGLENASSRVHHLSSYVNNLSSAHADKPEYAQESARNSVVSAQLEKLESELLRMVKGVDAATFAQFGARQKLEGMDYYLQRLRERSEFAMAPGEEKLAADLGVDGIHAWGRLYDTLTGKLTFPMKWPDGREETLPISRWRALLGDTDPQIRKAAHTGGDVAWGSIQDACAAALNAIGGWRLTTYRHRGIDDFLYPALFSSALKRESLDAMYAAIRQHIEPLRDIFRAKAAASGRQGIAFWEREAPLPVEGASSYSWDEGSGLVSKAFTQVYPKLGGYYDSFLCNGWMESEARGGKRPGAYCTGSPVTGEQRVYMTFNGSINEVGTIAHELGHAFHGHILKEFRPVRQRYPMTLAETASIFAELILAEGVYNDSSIPDSTKLLMLDTDLTGAGTLLLDIFVRFEFERAFYEERKQGEVSVQRLKELMAQKQREVFGDALAVDGTDEYFWASKLHFYISRVTFYNFPYTVGFMLARALFARFKQQGSDFLPRYEDFLRLTGGDTVENVVRQTLDEDTTSPAFWSSSIDSLVGPLAQFKKLLGVG